MIGFPFQLIWSGLSLWPVIVLTWVACAEDATAPDQSVGADGGVTDGALPLGETSDPLHVRVAQGIVPGDMDGQARRFLAIPYARPPVGDLRFRGPLPPQAWEGVRHTSDFVESCPQLADQGAPASQNEDCLYLNVWAPLPTPTRAPVIGWIHGGGNFSGGAGIPIPGTQSLWYDGRAFAERQGVVLVTLQYRLGPLGWNPHPGLSAEGEPSGNQGLQDQRAALEWVRDNISAFGGDPANVTLFGESAGAANVCYHLASPGSRGLFHRAISQSGGCTIRTVGRERSSEDAAEQMVAYGEALGCPPGADQLECMRELPVDRILEAAMQPMPGAGATRDGARWSFAAVVDGPGGVLPDHLRDLFEQGEVAQVPYLLGSNHDEGTTLVWRAPPIATEEAYLADLEMRFGEAASEIAALYPAEDFGGSYNLARERVVGDSRLVCGTHDTARLAARAGLDVFMYSFDYPWAVLPLILKAGHAAEISHVFGVPYVPTPDSDSEALGEAMNSYWARFASTGDPNGPQAQADWPRFDPDEDKRLHLAPGLQVLDDFRARECEFWRGQAGVD